MQPSLKPWKLGPRDGSLLLWNFSSRRTDVLVRARTASEARVIAAKSFAQASHDEIPRAVTSRWLDHGVVQCLKYGKDYDHIQSAGVIQGDSGVQS